MAAGNPPTRVYLEVGARRVFACSFDWPGWARSGKDEERALATLADYVPRYAQVAAAAGLTFAPGDEPRFDVVERVPGNATTDFGAPGVVPQVDSEPMTAAEAKRQAALVAAAWTVLDDVAAGAPEKLRKGPRGGGRDRDPMLKHVLVAETSYARQLGVKHRQPALGDTAAIKALRTELIEALQAARDGVAPTPKGWPPRYAARRIAWHVLDHAWEIEDKSDREDG